VLAQPLMAAARADVIAAFKRRFIEPPDHWRGS
jgi:hypothetical protein